MFSNRSTKSNKRSFGQRRTVVQLEDDPRRQPTYGFGYKPAEEVPKPEGSSNALSGLMSHYAVDSFSDDNSGDEVDKIEEPPPTNDRRKGNSRWPLFVAATDTQLPTPQPPEPSNDKTMASSQSMAPTGTEGEAKDDIDLKLKDFLAEIESIEVPGSEEGTTEEKPAAEAKPVKPIPESDDNDVGTSEDDSTPPAQPKEPTTVWQHCLDEGTQCYYYWNTDSNEVTWEIPVEFSQYLLRYKEYERLLAKHEKEMAEWKKSRGSKKAKKKNRKHKKKVEDNEEKIEPLVSYPPIDEEEENTKEELVYGPEKPPAEVLKKLADEESEAQTAEKAEEILKVDEDKPKVVVSVESSDGAANEDTVTKKHHHHHHHHKSSKKRGEDESCESKAGSHNHKTKSHDQVPSVKPPGSPVKDDDAKSVTELDAKSVAESSKDCLIIEPEVPKNTVEEEDIDDDEFVRQQLEEPVFTRYEYVNKKFAGDENDSADLAFEDIDRELELALEKQQSKVDEGSGDKKRKQEETSDSSCKRRKLEDADVNVSVDEKWKTSIRNDITTKVNELAEILDLASTVMEKLEFLEVSPNSLSKLQILLIQTETRLHDWKIGGLSTDYLLEKLRESAGILRQYEQTAGPPGWSCVWDRDFRRYFYSNSATGETSWIYPEVIQEDQNGHEKVRSEGSEWQQCAADEMGTSTQASDDGRIVVCTSELSDVLPVSVPDDLLSWAANPPPPPPPPATPPPPSPGAEADPPPPPPSLDQLTEDPAPCDMELDDELSEGFPVKPDSTSNQDAVAILDVETVSMETVSSVHKPQVLSCQISAPPSITPVACASPQSVPVMANTDTSASVSQINSIDGIPIDDLTSHPVKEKKKKKDKLVIGGSLSMKKKNVSSMVEKWQKIQDDVSKEMEKERSKQAKLAELGGKTNSSKND